MKLSTLTQDIKIEQYKFYYHVYYCKSGYFRPAFTFAIFANSLNMRKFEPGKQSKNLKLGLELVKLWQKFKLTNMSGAAKTRK